MKVNTKSYPHPVIGNEDDINGVFTAEFKVELSKNEVALNPTYTLKNSVLEDLIKKGRASFMTEVTCPGTFYRSFFQSRDTINKFIIPAKLLRERVTTGFYIIADEDIKNYTPSDCHPDYAGVSFDIEKGEVLGVGGYSWFVAEKGFDPMRPPVSSFMSIVEGYHHEGPVEIDYSGEKITIELSKADYQNFLSVKSQKITYGAIHASVVLPVLVDSIYQVKNNSDDYGDRNWFARLESILETKGLNNKEPFEAAQRILEYPVTRNFDSLNSMLETADEGEEND